MTRRTPVEMLGEEVLRLHLVPDVPATTSFGVTRQVPVNTPMVTFDHGSFSVPHHLLGETVWVRARGVGDGEQVVIVHVGPGGPVEVARHLRAAPGTPRNDESHFPPQPAGTLNRAPKPRTAAETELCALWDRSWLAGKGVTPLTNTHNPTDGHHWAHPTTAPGQTPMSIDMIAMQTFLSSGFLRQLTPAFRGCWGLETVLMGEFVDTGPTRTSYAFVAKSTTRVGPPRRLPR